MKRKIFKTLLLIVSSLCIIFASQIVLADTEKGYEYTISSGEATITAFPGYHGEKKVVIPDTLGGCPVVAIEKIRSSCDPVQTLVIPDTVTYIGDNCFYSWVRLEDITWSDNLTHIGEGSFYGIGEATSIDLPDSVEYIGELAFSSCYNVTDIYLGANVEIIGDGAFSGCGKLESISVDSGNECFIVSDDCLYSSDKDRLLVYPCALQQTSFAIAPTVKAIGRGAFMYASCLREISIPESVNTIGVSAFWGCSALESVIIPENVTRIEDTTFNFCESLKYVSLPDGLTYIGVYAFAVCRSLEEIELPASLETLGNFVFEDSVSMNELVLPHGVKNIPMNVVSYGSVRNIYVPSTVTTIDQYAFFFSPVRNIYYSGTEAEWNAIEGVSDAVDEYITVYFNREPGPRTSSAVTSDGTKYTVKISKKDLDKPASAIVVGYKSGKSAQTTVVDFDDDSATTTLYGSMDTVKIMTVESLATLKPLCELESIDEIE